MVYAGARGDGEAVVACKCAESLRVCAAAVAVGVRASVRRAVRVRRGKSGEARGEEQCGAVHLPLH